MDRADAEIATKPPSEAAAHEAIVSYFASQLKNPDSARYSFLPLTNGVVIMVGKHKAGWFMCGTVNSKNSFGGYAGLSVFIVHFDQSEVEGGPNKVDYGAIDGEPWAVQGWCVDAYKAR